MCVLTAPSIFAQCEEDGRVVLLLELPEPPEFEAVQEAVAFCPSGALSICELE